MSVVIFVDRFGFLLKELLFEMVLEDFGRISAVVRIP